MKVAITGISSFLASEIIPLLEEDGNITDILGIDIVKPNIESSKIIFIERDVRDPQLEEDIQGTDAIIHLAFIIRPIKSQKEIYSINIDGSKNVFDCAVRAGIKKVIHASSAAAYGAFPDNPIPLTEAFPIRKMKKKFYYHDTKYLVEKYIDELEKEHPEVIFTRIRPHIFLGKDVNNVLRSFFKGNNFYGIYSDNLWQFVHVKDVAQAFYLALIKDAPGIFNIGGDNPMTLREIGKNLNLNVKNLPYWLCIGLLTIVQKLRILRKDFAGWIRISRYPMIMDSSRAKEILGWIPKYDTMATIKMFYNHLKEMGVL